MKEGRKSLHHLHYVPHEFEGGSDEGGCDDVVDEEGAVVGQEDALPPELVLTTVVPDNRLEKRPVRIRNQACLNGMSSNEYCGNLIIAVDRRVHKF